MKALITSLILLGWITVMAPVNMYADNRVEEDYDVELTESDNNDVVIKDPPNIGHRSAPMLTPFTISYRNGVTIFSIEAVAVAVVVVLFGLEVAVLVMVLGETQQNHTISENTSYSSKVALSRLLNSKQVDVWDVYAQRNGMSDIYAFVDERINELCDNTIKAIDEFVPEFWEKNSKEKVRSNLGLLFVNYLFDAEK